MRRLLVRLGAIVGIWAGLSGPILGATPAELDRLGAVWCQSLGGLVIQAAAGREAGVSEVDAQAALARIPPSDPEVRRLTQLSIARVYRDRRPGTVIAGEVVSQCIAALPHRRLATLTLPQGHSDATEAKPPWQPELSKPRTAPN